MKFFTIILFVLICFRCEAQDIHFTQFYASPLTLNPASTGHFDGDLRIMNNIRNQWKAIPVPYNTITLGADKHITQSEQPLSMGIIAIHDQSAGILAVNKFYLSASLPVKVGPTNLNIGLQGGFVVKSYPLNQLTFPQQFDMSIGYFNAGLNNSEANLDQSLFYPDVNAGVLWTWKKENTEVEVGYAVFHLTQPRETFLPGNNKLPIRNVAHAGAKIFVHPKIFISPNFIIMQHQKANTLMAGSNVGFMLPGNHLNANYIFAGGFFRDGVKRNYDALAFIAGIKFVNLEIGVSYDINMSALETATHNRGAFEISLIYITGIPTLKNKTIPCERL